MKIYNLLPFLFLVLSSVSMKAQEQIDVNGKIYTVFAEANGAIDLLYNKLDGEFRYLARKGNSITELKNTKKNGEYQEEYRTDIKMLTADENLAVEDVNLTVPSLKEFFDKYNALKDPNYAAKDYNVKLITRLGAFAGVTNNVYFLNPENKLAPQIGIDFELASEKLLKRHAVIVQFVQQFASSDYDFSFTEFSLNYRFKFIKSQKFDVFVNTKFASYVHISRDITVINDNGTVDTFSGNGGDLRVPGSFGLGADIALGKGYLTLNYNDIVSLGLENNGEFPVNLTVGYKVGLQ